MVARFRSPHRSQEPHGDGRDRPRRGGCTASQNCGSVASASGFGAAGNAWAPAKDRRGVEVVKIDLPEPATRQNLLDAYAAAFTANPKLKAVLLTHLSHRTGLVLPVAEIARMARTRGIDVILDAAHSWGQVEFNPRDLGIDFIGFNLHKWIGAPIGAGFLYIAKDRLADIDRNKADEDFPEADIRSRVHTGTVNFATVLTIPAALETARRTWRGSVMT